MGKRAQYSSSFTLDSFNKKEKKVAWQECGLPDLCKLAHSPPPVGRAENGRQKEGGADLPTTPTGRREESVMFINQ